VAKRREKQRPTSTCTYTCCRYLLIFGRLACEVRAVSGKRGLGCSKIGRISEKKKEQQRHNHRTFPKRHADIRASVQQRVAPRRLAGNRRHADSHRSASGADPNFHEQAKDTSHNSTSKRVAFNTVRHRVYPITTATAVSAS
jgi:hypothetical protein